MPLSKEFKWIRLLSFSLSLIKEGKKKSLITCSLQISMQVNLKKK